MSWYKDGSVNIEQGSKTVIGIGTKWTNPLLGVCAGQMLILKTANTIEICEIASVQSDTQLTLANQYSGASKTGVSYEIPTAPKVSIEALALRISEILNYYQKQMDGWQSVLTGTGDITLTAPDGRVVTIKSQKDLTEAIQKIDVNGIGCRSILSNIDSFQLNGFGFTDKTTKGNKPFEYAEIIQSGDGKTEAVQIALDFFSNSVKIRSGRLNKWNEWLDFITTANASADIVGALPAVKLGDSPTYKVGAQVNFDLKPKINGIEPIYIVESYQNGDSWYNKYSNGFIEQSGLIVTNTNEVNKTIATNVNLLTPMSTKTYSIDLSLSVFLGSWGWIKYAWGDRYKNNFWICSFSESKMSSNTFRWTVRGY